MITHKAFGLKSNSWPYPLLQAPTESQLEEYAKTFYEGYKKLADENNNFVWPTYESWRENFEVITVIYEEE